MMRIPPALTTIAAMASAAAFAVTVEVDPDCAGMGTVSWSQKAAADGKSSLTLKSSALDGYAFSGWRVDGETPDWGVDARNPSLYGVLVPTNAVLTAFFVECALDTLSFDFSEEFQALECGVPVEIPLNVDTESYPTLSFKGLPTGLRYDSRTLSIQGTPTRPSFCTVVATGRNESGYTFSQTFRCSVEDVQSDRMGSTETSITLGEYYHEEFATLFPCQDERTSTTLSGIPPGLAWNQSWDLLYGTPTKAGTYVVSATARFKDGRSESATSRIIVSSPDPDEYGVDVSGLEGLSVGDVLESGDVEIGVFHRGVGVTSVAGLPAGLSLETWQDVDGIKHYGAVGTVREPGLFTVRVGVAGGDSPAVAITRDVIVSDTPDRYLKASVSPLSPNGSGKVSGGGAISVVSGASLTAKASKGHVFAGWRDGEGEPADVGEGVDYRNPSLSYGADAEFDFLELFALFVTAAEDADLSISGLDGESFEVDADGSLDEEFAVESASIPSITAKGMPQGVSVLPATGSSYRLAYDSETASKRPSPGRYEVVLTAKNKSGAAASAAFLLTVSNTVDPRIDVDDDYGELVPGEEIEPIDLSDAVDFAKGETLSVSGLPRGLSFNKTANSITGAPTAPGYYTLTFTAKVVSSATTNASGRISYKYDTAKATAFMTVLPWPMTSIEVDDDAKAAGNTVSGEGRYKPGTKVTLRAKAAKGWVFAGWDGLWDVEGVALLNPSLQIVAGYDDLDVAAVFVPLSEDSLAIAQPDLTDSGFAAEFELGSEVSDGEYASLVLDLVETVSYPTVKVSGLPSGVKFSSSTLLLSGKPSKPGVYYATVAAKNAGGYSFTRILRVAVLDGNGLPPVEVEPENAAQIDFAPVDGLVTGAYYAQGSAVLEIGPSPVTGEMPVKAVLSGLPAGLSALTEQTEGGLAVSLVGTPTKVARYALTAKVTYADRKTLTSKAFVVLEDGGSAYLDVMSLDESLGTVSGAGVYSAGETVKLVAKPRSKCVFAGWLVDDGEGGLQPFAPLMETDGVDFRTSSVSFPFRPDDLLGISSMTAAFASSGEDVAPVVAVSGAVWQIDPETSSELAFAVDSVSLPALTAKNLPKGVRVDLARGLLVYEPTASAQSGIYAATLTAKNQSKLSGAASFEIRVANRTTDMIKGLDPSMDAYALCSGVLAAGEFIAPEVEDGVKLSVSGLPSGMSFKNGVVSGLPTKAGAYTVTFTATSGSGAAKKTGVATVTIVVSALPSSLVGTFNGFVYEESDSGGAVVGTFTATATAAGKISAVANAKGGTERFSSSGWLSADDGIAHAEMSQKNGSTLGIDVDSSASWDEWQMQGSCKTSKGVFAVVAQRNSFGAKDGCDEARAIASLLAGKYSFGSLKLTLDSKGSARISGKYNGRSVSGSTVLTIDKEEGMQVKLPIIDANGEIVVISIRFDGETYEPQWLVN